MLSSYGKREWLTILAIGVMFTVTFIIIEWWWAAVAVVVATAALLSFFRDPERIIPSQKHIHVSPADGTISSIHELDHFEPFGEGAVCVRIFLSVFNVHVNRAPCHCQVVSITHKPGKYLNALKPESAEENESMTLLLAHPVRREPVAAVRQVSGMIARTIECRAKEGVTLQRGQRFGMIKFGSTTELYLPKSAEPEILVKEGQKVKGGSTILARVASSPRTQALPGHQQQATPESSEGDTAPKNQSTPTSDTTPPKPRAIELTHDEVEPSKASSDSTVTDAVVPPPDDDATKVRPTVGRA